MSETKNKDWEPIKPIYILLAFFGFVVLYQSILMHVWITYPALDWILLRYSVSNGDIIAIFAFALAYMSYAYFYRAYVDNRKLKKIVDMFDNPLATNIGEELRQNLELTQIKRL